MTKGVWVPDKTKLGPGEVPLYLHIVAPSQIILDHAVQKVEELINKELGPLLDDRTMVARNRALGLPPPAGLLPGGRVKWPEDKLIIGLENLRNFNVRAKTVGPGVGSFCLFPSLVFLLLGVSFPSTRPVCGEQQAHRQS